MRSVRPTGALILAAVALACSACGGDGRPPVAPVQGRVLFNGKPLADAVVTFIHDGAPRYSYGTSDAQGNFTLTTYDPGDGAIVGANRVTVIKSPIPDPELSGDVPDPEAYQRAMARLEQAPAKAAEFPARYADPATSQLEVTVEEGENKPLLELVD